MKTRKWSVLLMAAMTALCMGSCSEDWGKMDPGAGNQVFPKLEKLTTYNFDGELDPNVVLTFPENGQVGIGQDEEYGDVLHMNGGYACIANPAATASIQKAVGLTFWMKQPAEDLEGALFSFQSEDGTSKLSFSANGWLDFTSPAGSYEANNPANGKTDILPVGVWHFVGVSIGNEEYVISVDGEEKIREAYSPAARAEGEGTIGDAILALVATAPRLYLGYGNDTQTLELMLDDVTTYRNEITVAQTKVPTKGGADAYEFPPKGTVGIYYLDGTFENALNPDQSGELVEVETQGTPSDFEVDEVRGTVWHQQEGWSGHANGWAYTKFANPLKGADLSKGVSVSLWINPPTLNWWDQIFVLNDGTAKFWFNAIGYLGYHSGGDSVVYFDCHNNNADNALVAGEWTFVTINVLPDGFAVYYNGELKFDRENNAKYDGTVTDFTQVVNMFSTSDHFFLGYEQWWKAAPALVDDIYLVNRPLGEGEVKNLYLDTQRSNGGAILSPAWAPSLKGYYPLDGSFANALNPDQGGEFVEVQTQGTPSGFEEDEVRGMVWHQQEGWTDHANGWGYTKFANPLKNADLSKGVSVSMWINPPAMNRWDQIFVLNDGTGKFWFNASAYLGYHSGGDKVKFFDCQQDNADNELPVGEWTLVTINVLPDGFAVYYNGELKFDRENNAKYNGDVTDFAPVVNLFSTSDHFFLGYEQWWKAAPALVDDIYLCASPLNESQAKAMYNATKK